MHLLFFSVNIAYVIYNFLPLDLTKQGILSKKINCLKQYTCYRLLPQKIHYWKEYLLKKDKADRFNEKIYLVSNIYLCSNTRYKHLYFMIPYCLWKKMHIRYVYIKKTNVICDKKQMLRDKSFVNTSRHCPSTWKTSQNSTYSMISLIKHHMSVIHETRTWDRHLTRAPLTSQGSVRASEDSNVMESLTGGRKPSYRPHEK